MSAYFTRGSSGHILQKNDENAFIYLTPYLLPIMYECEHLTATLDNFQSVLEQYGVAIIPNVLTSEECQKTTDQMWDYFEHLSSEWPTVVSRNNSATWPSIPKNTWMKHGQLLQHPNQRNG